MPFVLHVFGAVQATWDGLPLKFATEHARALLVYLAVEADVVHPRTTLATLLWPDESEVRARHNLRQALFFLKQALRGVPGRDTLLHITPTTLRWNSQGVAVDLHTFQQAWQFSQTHSHADRQQCSTCLDHFRQALALYQGEFVQGVLLKDNQPFEEWALLLREQCHRQAMAMFGALISYHLAVGAYEQAAHDAARQVAIEPWHEEGHRHLIQALAAQGQQIAALRQYEHCRRILQQELGVPPSSETTKLYEQIRAGKFDKVTRHAARSAAPWQGDKGLATHDRPVTSSPLLGALPPLVGRSQQLEQLRSWMGTATQRLLTIVGLGGMGKSRLALGLLEQLVVESPPPFADGVWFVPLIGVSPNVEHLADALAGATLKTLGITTPNQEALPRALFHYLAQRQLLLVFDNFEHLLVEDKVATAASEFIRALLQAAPGVSLVITSRLPLQLLAETVIRLEGLPVPPALTPKLDPQDVANYESVRLFVYHAQRTLPDFTLRDDNLPAVVELCRALSGMPLAIELAAALASHFTPAELVTAIRQNLDLLVSRRRDLDARHRHFSAVLESSWQLLSAREQTILAQSSIFVGRFSRAAAQAVTGALVSELASLVDKALIQQTGVGVYQLHDLLRQFAAHKLQTAADEASAVADRHSAFYLHFVAARERMLTRHQPRQAVQEIQQEVDNVRQAWTWTVTHTTQAPSAAAICARLAASAYGLWHFYLIAGLYAEGVAAFQQASAGVQVALAASPATVAHRWQSLLSKLLALEAYMLGTHGSYTTVPTIAQQAIALGATYGGNEGEIIGLLALAQAHYYNGAPDAAKAAAGQVLQRVRQLASVSDPAEYYYDVQFMAYLYLGAIAINADEYEQARTQVTQALQLCQPLGKLRGEMHARLNLANLARYKQNYTAARQDYQQALQIACELGYRRGEAVARYELADVLRGLGEYTAALEQFALALTILREIGEPFHENYAQMDVGRLYAYLGDFERARDLIHEALLRSEHFTMLDAKLDAWLAVALLHQLAGEASEALPYATRCHQLAGEHNNRRYEGCALLYMGHALEGLERWPEANAAYANALQLYQQLDIQPIVVEAHAGLARVALAQGDRTTALGWVEKIWAILADYPSVGLDEPFQIYLTCYRVLAANHEARASILLQRGHDLLQQYAAQIQDHRLRCSFLENVVIHRALKQQYEDSRPVYVPA